MEGLDLRWGRFVLKTCDFIGLISTCAQASEVGSQTNEDLNVGLVRAWRHVLRGNDVRLCVEGGKMQFIPACRNEGVQESGCDEDSQLEAMRAELLLRLKVFTSSCRSVLLRMFMRASAMEMLLEFPSSGFSLLYTG